MGGGHPVGLPNTVREYIFTFFEVAFPKKLKNVMQKFRVSERNHDFADFHYMESFLQLENN